MQLMPKYEWKTLYEAARAAVFAFIAFALTAIAGLGGGGVEDWESWALGLAAGGISAAAAAGLAILTRNASSS